MKHKNIIYFVIRVIIYFVLLLLTAWYKSNDGIENIFIIFPVYILLFEVIFLQIKYKNFNLFAILRNMGKKKIIKHILTIVGSVTALWVLIGLFALIISYSLQNSALKRHNEMRQSIENYYEYEQQNGKTK